MQVSGGSQQHRSRLAPLAASGIAKWQQDFAFAVVLPLKTRPLVLELHESKGGRRKGRTLARAYIPLADLFPTGKSECEPLSLHKSLTGKPHARSWRMVLLEYTITARQVCLQVMCSQTLHHALLSP